MVSSPMGKVPEPIGEIDKMFHSYMEAIGDLKDGVMSGPEIQWYEMRNSFYGGVVTFRKIMDEASAPGKTELEGLQALDRVQQELEQFTAEVIKNVNAFRAKVN